MTILYIIFGLLCGAAICWFYLKSKSHPAQLEVQDLQQKASTLAERVQSLERDKAKLASDLDTLRTQAQSYSQELAATKATLQSERDSSQNRMQLLETHNADLSGRFESTQTELIDHKGKLSQLQAFLSAEQDKYEKLHQDTEQTRQNLFKEFENLANRILEEKSEKFTKLNQTNLDNILSPLRTKITEFEQTVKTSYNQESAERHSLRGEIKTLFELNQQNNEVTVNLTRALKGDSQKQGSWGELILEKVLEFSGLRKDKEYKTQESFTGEEGRQRPDVIVYLPENKHIIIDAKVSLVAYERYVNSEFDADRKQALVEHISSVRSHIKGLAERNYQIITGLNQPDFVLLFIPIESSFGLAIQADNDLFAFAWDKKVVIVSPSTLLATLRTISSVWKQERQTKNAIEIADRAGKMYDKFAGFIKDLENVGKYIDSSKESYSNAMNKLKDGSGNLIRQAEQLKEMGAKASKQLSQELLDRAE